MATAKSKSMKTVSLKLPPALDSQLGMLARRRSVGKSALIREALVRYVAAGPQPAGGSFLALAGHLAGCVEGPSDLSVNAEHLKGYGR
jgi:Ribbon-helix-helix protein, copG family